MNADDDIEQLLERVICGDASADDPAVREILTRHRGALERLEQLKALQAEIGRIGAETDADVAAAQDNVTAADRKLVRQAASRRQSPWQVLLLAAAALVIAGVAWWAWPAGPQQPTGLLSHDGQVRIERIDDSLQVTFDQEAKGSDHFRLQLVSADGTLDGRFEIETQAPGWRFPTDWIAAARAADTPELRVQFVNAFGTQLWRQRVELSPLLR